MTLLGAYIATNIFSYATWTIASASVASGLKREKYEFITKKTFAENLYTILSNVFVLSIPVFNIFVCSVILLSGDRFYDEMKKDLLKKNRIRKQKIDDVKVEFEDKESNIEYSEVKKFSELTNEEKLRFLNEERAKLINEENEETYSKILNRKW